jgi:hypothetical protein
MPQDSKQSMDDQILQLMGGAIKDPKAAKSGVQYIKNEFERMPEEGKYPDIKNPQEFYGGSPKSYVEKMLNYGNPKIEKGENVAEQINNIFGPNSHSSFYNAFSKMTPDQQQSFANFLQQFGQVTEPAKENTVGTKLRQAITAPNKITRALGF